MSLPIDDPEGALAPTLLPFSLYESRDDSELPEYTKLLGKVYERHGGLSVMLVRALGDYGHNPIDAGFAYTFDDEINYVARPASAVGEKVAGYTVPRRKNVKAGELMWLVISDAGGGDGRFTVACDPAAVLGDYLGASAIPGIMAPAGYSADPGVTPAQALTAVVVGENWVGASVFGTDAN